MNKLDLKKQLNTLYKPAKDFSIVDVPAMNYLMIDGQGNPNTSQSFQEAIEALFSVSYAVKFLSKKGNPPIDYTVMPLEGLWWTDDMTQFALLDKDKWLWTVMILQPEHITENMIRQATEETKKKKAPPALSKLYFESYNEGLSVQILYVGPYADEAPTIKRMHDFATDKGHELRGKHHEIYLSDFRKTTPDKLKTVIRQPIQ